MSRSTKVCNCLALLLLYLLVNVRLVQLGKSFPITIATFLPVLPLLFIKRISIEKLMIAPGVGGGLTVFNYLFGQSLDANKYVTLAMLFVYTVVIIGMAWSIHFKTISPHNYVKILRLLWLVVGLTMELAAIEMIQMVFSNGSGLMRVISKYPIYSNSYVPNFTKFGEKRTAALYSKPAFFTLALISARLSIKQFSIKTSKSDTMILAGIVLSGSFSGVIASILFYLLEWTFQYLNKDTIKEKLLLAVILLNVSLVEVVFVFPYIVTRPDDLRTEGSSLHYRIIGPLTMIGYSLPSVDGIVRFGSFYEYVISFEIFNGTDIDRAIDNDLYLLIIYFSWSAVILAPWYMGRIMKMMISTFGDNRNYRVQLYFLTSLSLFFIDLVFSPKYVFLIVYPSMLRKTLNIMR